MMKKSDNDDLVTLTNLNEQIVLDELKQRYFKNKIYVCLKYIIIFLYIL